MPWVRERAFGHLLDICSVRLNGYAYAHGCPFSINLNTYYIFTQTIARRYPSEIQVLSTRAFFWPMWHGNEVQKVHETDEWDFEASGQYAYVYVLLVPLIVVRS